MSVEEDGLGLSEGVSRTLVGGSSLGGGENKI